MAFNIEIITTSFIDKGKFKEASITHKTDDGKVDNRRLVNFGDEKEVFKKLTAAKRGDRFQITAKKIKDEKSGKEHWRWVEAEPFAGENTTTAVQSPKASPRGTYETPEERAAKQVYIVRQSSITNAINFLVANSGGTKFDASVVLEVAKKFEDHVFKQNVELPIVEVE